MTGFQLPDEDAVLAELAKRRLREYVKQAWHVVEPATPFVGGFHIDAICDHAQAVQRREIRNLLVTIAPRHTKSICVSIAWPTWAWTFEPSCRFLFASYSQDLSTKHSVDCRRLLDSQWYQQRWGHVFALTTDQNVKQHFENDQRGYRIATSVGASVTGFGGEVLVIDDPHNLKEIDSDIIRHGVLDWYDKVWKSRLNDPKRGCKVIIMQRGHATDLAAHVLAEDGWTHLNLPTEYEPTTWVSPIGWTDPRTEAGQLLCSERFGPVEVAEAKKSAYVWASQHQQRPAPAEGGRVKRLWFRYWHHPGQVVEPVPVRTSEGLIMVPSVPLPATFDEALSSWDLTFKDAKAASKGADIDYVVGQVWGRKGADKFCLDMERDRLDFPATLEAFRAMAQKWPQARAKLVEDKANGPAVIATLKHELEGLIPMGDKQLGGDKGARLAAVSPQIESGNVYLPHPAICSWTERIIYECITFPNADHDDALDALTQALIRFSSAGNLQVYGFRDVAGKPVPVGQAPKPLTRDERFMMGLSVEGPEPVVARGEDDQPARPEDTMTPEQRFELGIE